MNTCSPIYIYVVFAKCQYNYKINIYKIQYVLKKIFVYIIINNVDANLINSLFSLLPNRTSTTTGNIGTNLDLSELDLTTVQSKNWNIS